METLKTILYFSIFRYPLKLEEIHGYTNYSDINYTSNELQHLLNEKIITKIDDFYVYGSDLDSVTKRLRGNLNAKKITPKALERAHFISKFPFVEAVGISGSLSKGYYDENSDIDFFVITKPEKLWVCRTFLMLYKKIFLLNSRKYFCVNYFMASSNLEVEEQNRFTATELKTLIPLRGQLVFKEFYNKNKWIYNYFSKFSPNVDTIKNTKKPLLTKTIELIIDNKIGDFVDDIFKFITLRKWHSKFGHMDKTDFNIALKSTKNISKHHPSNFQKKVILSLNEKMEEVQKKFNILLVKEHV